MSYVSEVSSDEAPTVLIVDNNQMSIMRLREVFKKRGFATQVCEDGDLAVDEYIKLDPELVVMSLDIPSLDGHLAALEMREHGGDSRILFIAPNRLRELAVHATYSAGAVGWLAKPVSQAQLDEIWDQVLGPIPEAPGLEVLMNCTLKIASSHNRTKPNSLLLPSSLLLNLFHQLQNYPQSNRKLLKSLVRKNVAENFCFSSFSWVFVLVLLTSKDTLIHCCNRLC